MPLESMPLAAGYLKASVLADEPLRTETDIRIFNFNGGHTTRHMARALFLGGAPDVLAFSVLGWNFGRFGTLSETFRQLNPAGWIIWGGTHVANQGERVFRLFPAVDIVVNGEGELTFRELVAAYLSGRRAFQLHGIDGVSFRDADGQLVTTSPRPRIADLDSLPSPFLSGAIPLTGPDGCFPYDVALMETNRGCPYHCAFCYWGGAIGQKIRAFSRDRIREELEWFGFHRVATVCLCDANFGMLRSDAEFVEDLISVRAKYGFPQAVETSWAKNKSKIFRSIVRRMKEHDLSSSFTLALQTLSEEALEAMDRRNMRLNEWEELADWLAAEGMSCYAELIWGAPGETSESFMAGYDRLAERVARIATYPLLLLPNTAYAENRDRFGLVTVRGERDDFEYVIAHETMSVEENQRMERFLFWARTVAENMYFRYIWMALRAVAGITQSQALLRMADWFDASDDPAARPLRSENVAIVDAELVARTVRYLFSCRDLEHVIEAWWKESVFPCVPEDAVGFLEDVFRFDVLSRPIYDADAGAVADLPIVERDGVLHYVREDVPFAYDVPRAIEDIRHGGGAPAEESPCSVTFEYPCGFHRYVDNHEVGAHYFAQSTCTPLALSGASAGQQRRRKYVAIR